MEVKAARNMSVFTCFGRKSVRSEVCSYWLAGRCNRNPCRFMHSLPPSPAPINHPKQSRNKTWKRSPEHSVIRAGDEGKRGENKKKILCDELILDERKGGNINSSTHTQLNVSATGKVRVQGNQSQPKQCKYWVDGTCVHSDKCKDVHSWCYGSGFTKLTKLEGHSGAISGISLPSGHDKLYSGGKDGCIRVWDCHSGQCAGLVNVNGEVGCLITVSPWLFVGLHSAVKAWNIENGAEFTLNGSGGLVCSLVTIDDMLFAGTEDGSILVWRWQPRANIPELAALLKEHDGAVRSLIMGGGEVLCSGSGDHTIKVWDIRNFKCMQTLRGHTRDVTGIFVFDRCLLSASLDNTLKVWAGTEHGVLEVVHEIKDNHGIHAMCGVHSAETKPILLCSYDDNSVRLYDFPSFEERGRMFSKRRVTTIQIGGISGLFFTGDTSGEISVCKLLDSLCPETS